MRKDGTEFAVDINLSPLPEGPEEGHVMCVLRDVSQRRSAEEKIRVLNQSLERHSAELAAANQELSLRNQEVERANRLKSEFLASMSHELRTPLNTILGFSELLAELNAGPLNEKQKRFLSHIQHDASHLLALINDVLDLSKIEAGRLELRLEEFPMAVAVAEVLTSMRPLAATQGIRLDSELDTQLVLLADRLRFKEILYNLLSNAIKFTPSGGRVWVESSCEEGTVRILVGDTGIGIEPEDQQSDIRELPPGQRDHQRRARRNRVGPRDHETAGGASRRKNLGGKRARQRQPVLLYADGSASGKKSRPALHRRIAWGRCLWSPAMSLPGARRFWSNCSAKGSAWRPPARERTRFTRSRIFVRISRCWTWGCSERAAGKRCTN